MNQDETKDVVTLDPADYWKLMKLMGDVDLAQAKAAALLGTAASARNEYTKTLAAKYDGFIADGAHYRADDTTYTLIRER